MPKLGTDNRSNQFFFHGDGATEPRQPILGRAAPKSSWTNPKFIISPCYRGEHHLAKKLPTTQFEATAAFCHDVLNMEATEVFGKTLTGVLPRSVSVEVGSVTPWWDRVDNYGQAEVW